MLRETEMEKSNNHETEMEKSNNHESEMEKSNNLKVFKALDTKTT